MLSSPVQSTIELWWPKINDIPEDIMQSLCKGFTTVIPGIIGSHDTIIPVNPLTSPLQHQTAVEVSYFGRTSHTNNGTFLSHPHVPLRMSTSPTLWEETSGSGYVKDSQRDQTWIDMSSEYKRISIHSFYIQQGEFSCSMSLKIPNNRRIEATQFVTYLF